MQEVPVAVLLQTALDQVPILRDLECVALLQLFAIRTQQLRTDQLGAGQRDAAHVQPHEDLHWILMFTKLVPDDAHVRRVAIGACQTSQQIQLQPAVPSVRPALDGLVSFVHVVIVDVFLGLLGDRLFEKLGTVRAGLVGNLIAAATEKIRKLLQCAEDQVNRGQPLLAIDEFPLVRAAAADDYWLQAIEVRRIGLSRRQLERGQILQQILNLSSRPAITPLVGRDKEFVLQEIKDRTELQRRWGYHVQDKSDLLGC